MWFERSVETLSLEIAMSKGLLSGALRNFPDRYCDGTTCVFVMGPAFL